MPRPARCPAAGRPEVENSPEIRPPGRGVQCAFTALEEHDHRRVTLLCTIILETVVFLIEQGHVTTTMAASRRPPASLRGVRPDRPPSARGGHRRYLRPALATVYLQFRPVQPPAHQHHPTHAVPAGCFHHLQPRPAPDEPPRPEPCARSWTLGAAQFVTRAGRKAASTLGGSIDWR